MPIVTLRDLYIAELQDLVDAERQIIASLPELAAAATSTELRDAFQQHLAETRVQLERLELLMRKLDVRGDTSPCEAMRGLISEARRRITNGERGDVLDAALIGAAQRIEHYEIAAYGCARTYARTLGDRDAAALLQQTLDEEGNADHRLSGIAERGINKSAAEDVAVDTERQKARLRYIPPAGLRDFKYREFRVTNAQNEDLGTLEGLIVDARTDTPVYLVIDSGRWLAGRRYLVPVGLMQPDDTGGALRTTLDRETIHRYPPFNADAFDGSDTGFAAAYGDPSQYQPPTWLMTGVWMTEASGYAAVPPRAHAEITPAKDSYPENELMMARGEPEGRGEEAQRQQPAPKREDDEPRIERYPER